LIKEANNDAGLAAHPSARWYMNCVHFQLAMLAYNLNCWLILFNREEQAKTEDLKHITLATARLRFLFLAAKIVRHAGAVMVRYSDHYAEQGILANAAHEPITFDRARRSVCAGGADAAEDLSRHAQNFMHDSSRNGNELRARDEEFSDSGTSKG
jgi:Transposase DDE domain group 1